MFYSCFCCKYVSILVLLLHCHLLFLLGFVCITNSYHIVTVQAEELKNAVGSDYGLWISQYLVMKRASIEPNFHQLYIDFMDALTIANLAKEVLKETFRNIKVSSPLQTFVFCCCKCLAE